MRTRGLNADVFVAAGQSGAHVTPRPWAVIPLPPSERIQPVLVTASPSPGPAPPGPPCGETTRTRMPPSSGWDRYLPCRPKPGCRHSMAFLLSLYGWCPVRLVPCADRGAVRSPVRARTTADGLAGPALVT